MKTEERNLAVIYDFLTAVAPTNWTPLSSVCRTTTRLKGRTILFRMAEPRVRGNIIAGLGTRLKVFQSQAVRDLP